MPRFKQKEKMKHVRRESVFSLVFPLLSILYAELVYSHFLNTDMTVFKILFALAAGCIAVAFSRVVPWKWGGYFLQTVWILFCIVLISLQYIVFKASGEWLSLFSQNSILAEPSELISTAQTELRFLLFMAVPVLLQFAVQSVALLRRESLIGSLLGGNGMEFFGMLLLSLILTFVSVFLAFDDESARRLIEKEYIPQASAASFGVLPQNVLDLKFNVLHIKEEDVIHHYIVTENGEYVELTEQELEKWNREG